MRISLCVAILTVAALTASTSTAQNRTASSPKAPRIPTPTAPRIPNLKQLVAESKAEVETEAQEESADTDRTTVERAPNAALPALPARATDQFPSEPTASDTDSAEPDSHDDTPAEVGSPRVLERLPPLTPRLVKIRKRVREALNYYQHKNLNTRDHNPWEVMHAIVAYGANSQLNRNGPDGEQVNSVCWLCWNGDCHGVRILDVEDGRVIGRKGPYVQGHPGQFLAILAQSRISPECPIRVEGKSFTVADLIESEKLGCKEGMELTFKLIALSYYLDINTRWLNSSDETWSIDRLIHEEIAQPIVGAACGGTHRLMGLAYAVRKRERSGEPIDGEFARARKFLDDYHRYTFRLQNPDGSFSTEWFKGRGDREDLNRRVQTSGHILEWLSYSLPESQLTDPRVLKALEYLTGILLGGKKTEWEIGPVGHALHALAIYDHRMFQRYDRENGRNVAEYDDEGYPNDPLSDVDIRTTAFRDSRPDAENDDTAPSATSLRRVPVEVPLVVLATEPQNPQRSKRTPR